jgi:carbon-monoxide dehydrogenase large subunit
MLDVAFVRSALPHAEIRGIDLSEALAMEGVVAAVTAADLEVAGVQPVPDFPTWANPVATYPLCRGRARYVGAPLAAVVAEDRYIAEDAAETIYPDCEPLEVVASIDAALAPDAPLLYEGWENNRIVDYQPVNHAADEAFARLRTVRGTYETQRHGASPIEACGAAAEYRLGRLTVWTSTQLPHIARSMYAMVLGLPERAVHVIAPDVGGGFGLKAEIYPEEYVVAWLALHLRRPVRWIEDRYEHLISSCHARECRVELEAAVHQDGRIEALRGTVWQDLGSGEIFPNGFSPGFVTAGSLVGPYRIAEQSVGVVSLATNKCPSGAYRGFGIPEAAWAMERLIDRVAQELDLDPHDLRRRMIIEPDELPFTTAAGSILDSGSHRVAFDAAEQAGREALAQARAAHENDSTLRVGLGVATYVEGVAPSYFGTTGHWTSQDACEVRFDPDGGVTVSVGVAAYGQGLWTMVATLAAEELGLPLDQVRVVMGDTDTAPYGLGSWGSRSVTVVGGSLHRAAGQVRDKALRIAAHQLEASADDIEINDGRFHVRGSTEPSVSWADVARAALVRIFELPEGMDPGLEATATYAPPGVDHVPDDRGLMNSSTTYTNASHAAVVTVDIETGEVKVVSYIVAHDCGRVINPMLVDGQVHGGVAQGIGGALLEEFRYDESAQPLSTTFMDYLLPTATEIPPITTIHFESPSPHAPLGAKGAGEAGVIGPAPAIASAVEDALAEFRIPQIVATPITPQSVREALRAGREGPARP